MLFGLIIIVAISSASWTLFFNRAARRWLLRFNWALFKMNKDQRQLDESVSVAVLLISGIVSTTFLLSMLLLALTHLLR
jgi:hypothetical protein